MRWVFWSAERRLPFKAWDGSVTQTQAADDSPPSHLLPTAVRREPAAGVEMWEQDSAGFWGWGLVG